MSHVNVTTKGMPLTSKESKVKKIVFIAAALIAGPALASDICAEHPEDKWMSAEAVTAHATAKGFEVRKVKKEDGCWEIKGTKDGKRVEAYFDPVSGELVKTK